MKTAMECWVSNGMNLDNYSQAVKEAMEEYASQSVEKQSLMKEYIIQSVPPTPVKKSEHICLSAIDGALNAIELDTTCEVIEKSLVLSWLKDFQKILSNNK